MTNKLTKTEALEAAKRWARQDEGIAALTVDQINAMDYQARRAFAAERGCNHPLASIDTQARYLPDVKEAFLDTATALMGAKVRELENKRHAWKVATSGLTSKEAAEKVAGLLCSMNIRGAKVDTNYGVRMEVERSFGAGGTLYVKFDREHDSTNAVTNPDAPDQKAGRIECKVEVSWSGTTRSLSEAELGLKVYRELLDAAHEVQAVMDRERVMWVYGVPEPKLEGAAPEVAAAQ